MKKTAGPALSLVPQAPKKPRLRWTAEVIHEMIETRPAAVGRALCSLVRDRALAAEDQPYAEHVVRWLLGAKNRELTGEMLERGRVIARCYAQRLADEVNGPDHLRRADLEKGPEPLFPPAMGFTVVGSKGDAYVVTTGHWYGAQWQGWACTCPDYFFRHRAHGTACKHIYAVAPAAPAKKG